MGQGKFSSQLTNAKTRQAYSTDKLTESAYEGGLFDFSFLPTESGVYRLALQFNDLNIKGEKLFFI